MKWVEIFSPTYFLIFRNDYLLQMTEDKMAGWHHRLDGHEFEQAPGVSEGQGNLACCSPWGLKELDTTE